MLELPTDWPLDDWPHYMHNRDFRFTMPIASPRYATEMFRAEFDAAWNHGALWVSVWHPFLSGRLAKLDAVVELIDYMQGEGRRLVRDLRGDRPSRAGPDRCRALAAARGALPLYHSPIPALSKQPEAVRATPPLLPPAACRGWRAPARVRQNTWLPGRREMPKLLSEEAVRRFNERGYLAPVPVLDPDEVAALQARFAEFEAREGGTLKGGVRNKSHLFLRWVYDLVTHPRLLDAVEDLIGPNILLYHAQWFIKEPNTPQFVSFHQDSAYWSLSQAQGLSTWVALEPATIENGCMQVIPDTHKSALAHAERIAPENLLWRGQTVTETLDASKAVPMPLQPGEMSIHHARTVHGSGPNRSNSRRIGYSIRYIPTHIARTGPRDSAMLVRGIDEYGHFDLEPAPTGDYEPAAVALHADINKRFMEHYTTATPERAA